MNNSEVTCKVLGVEKVDGIHTTYDFKVDGGIFYVDSYKVHNCAEEMRLAGNFSREPGLVQPLLEEKDIHNHVAKLMFGYEDPDNRTKVKILNFSCEVDNYLLTDEGKLIKPWDASKHNLITQMGTSLKTSVRSFKSDGLELWMENGMRFRFKDDHQIQVQTLENDLVWKSVQDIKNDDFIRVLRPKLWQGSDEFLELAYDLGKSVCIDTESIFDENFTEEMFCSHWGMIHFEQFHKGILDNPELFESRINLQMEVGAQVAFILNASGVLTDADYFGNPAVKDGIVMVELTIYEKIEEETCTRVSFTKTLGNITLYAIECEPIHEYISNLIVSHNCLYGANEWTIAGKIGSTVQYAKELLSKYFRTLARLTAWKEEIIKSARRTGFVFTYFGRPRALYKYYSTSDPSLWAFADRSAVNSVIQGMIVGSSLAHTDAGLKTINSLKKDITVLDGNEKHPTLKVWNGYKYCDFGIYDAGVRDLYRLKLINGYEVVGADIHLVKIATDDGFEFRELQHLKEDDLVVTDYKRLVSGVKTPSFMLKYLENSSLYGERLSEAVSVASEDLESFFILTKHVGINLPEDLNDMSLVPVRYCKFLNKKRRTYCLSLWDESHQYMANGIIHHNCIPSSTFVEGATAVYRMSDFMGQVITLVSGDEAIVVSQQEADLYMFCFKSGDFIVCDMNHKLIRGSGENQIVEPVRNGLTKMVNTSKLRKKILPNLKGLLTISVASQKNYLKKIVKSEKFIVANDRYTATAFWKLALTFKWFKIDDKLVAASLRSLATLYGFNLIYSRKKDKFKVKFSRKSKVKYSSFFYVSTGQTATMSVKTGWYKYQAQGFENKNTGGDMCRILLCKIFDKVDKDPWFKANFEPLMVVHDDISVQVRVLNDDGSKFYFEDESGNKVAAIKYASDYLKEVMTLHPENFLVPMTVDMGIGSDWGNALDFIEMDNDGKIVKMKEFIPNE